MISIITPVLNEEENIGPFLSNLNELEGDFELILVDGNSTDGTLKEVERNRGGFDGKLRLLGSERGRAVQMNRGAVEASGNILLFLHADCSLPKDSLGLIEKGMHDEAIAGGGFRQAFSNPGFFLTFVSAFGNMRVKLTGTFYGDYGIFLRKDIFDKIGGYDAIPFLEDVEICRKAKKHGRLVRVERNIYTSPRRYASKGKIRLTAAFILANLFNIAGIRPGFLIRYIVDR